MGSDILTALAAAFPGFWFGRDLMLRAVFVRKGAHVRYIYENAACDVWKLFDDTELQVLDILYTIAQYEY